MTLQSAIDAALPELRREAVARMLSTCTVMRKTAGTDQDESTGEVVPVWAAVYVDAPFRLAGSERGGSGTRTVDIGGVTLQLAARVGHFPATTSDLADGDLIEVTGGENAGTVWRIVEADWQDQATARRVPLVAAERPTEWGA